jgi:hypothetical protein
MVSLEMNKRRKIPNYTLIAWFLMFSVGGLAVTLYGTASFLFAVYSWAANGVPWELLYKLRSTSNSLIVDGIAVWASVPLAAMSAVGLATLFGVDIRSAARDGIGWPVCFGCIFLHLIFLKATTILVPIILT